MEDKKQNNFGSNSNQQSSFLRRFATRAAIYTGTTAFLGCYGLPALLATAGFSSTGIAAGSWAAWWQSTHLLPATFSTLQSSTVTGATTGLFTQCGVGCALVKAYYDEKNNQRKKKDDKKPKLLSKL